MVNPHNKIMKNFIKCLAIILFGTYAVVSFVAWDITTIADWHIAGRGFYAIIVLILSAILSGESNNN